MPSSTKETLQVPGRPQLKGMSNCPKPPQAVRLMNGLTIAAAVLSILSSLVTLIKTMTPELYLQLVIGFLKIILIIVLTAVYMLWY